MDYKARKAGSIILGLTSAVGTIVTAILVAKETPKALNKINELKKLKQVKKTDYIKALAPIYWPAAVICLGTIASTTISQVMSIKTEASLIATSTMLNQGWNRYKGRVKDFFGKKTDQIVTTSIANEDYEKAKTNKVESDEQLYWEEHLGFFKCRQIDLVTALTDLNQRLHTPDPNPKGTFYWTTLEVLMDDARATVFDKTKLEACKNIGWTTDYLCEVYDLKCMWVHPEYTTVVNKATGEVLYTKISFFEDPIFLHDTELSRYHYKSRKEFEHNSELDMHDYDAFNMYNKYDDSDENCGSKVTEIQESFVNSKLDCSRFEDDGRRFIPSNLDNATIKYQNGEDYIEPNNQMLVDKNLPPVDTIPND